MGERTFRRNRRFSDVLVQRGTISQSLAGCATLKPCSLVVSRLISSPIAPLESYDLSLAFVAISRWNRTSIGCRVPIERRRQTVTSHISHARRGAYAPYAPPPPPGSATGLSSFTASKLCLTRARATPWYYQSKTAHRCQQAHRVTEEVQEFDEAWWAVM